MNDAPASKWSPADNPYAIAVSEAQWWKWTVDLCVRRIREGRDLIEKSMPDCSSLRYANCSPPRGWSNSPFNIWTRAYGGPSAKPASTLTRKSPRSSTPRNVLVHFDEYAIGKGKRQRKLRDRGLDAATVARQFWPFGYDPATEKIRVGPYEIHIEQAHLQAHQLCRAIYAAAQAVDAAGNTG